MPEQDVSLRLGPIALAPLVWVAGALLSWWLARGVATSISRGPRNGGTMVKVSRAAYYVTFYGALALLLAACLQIAGVPVSLRGFLDYPIANIGDEPVLVSNLLFAIALVLAGLVVSRWAARRANGYLVARQVDATAADAIQKLIFYVLVVAVVIAALEQLHVPMTSFAFLGGAVAIGVGFGAQNIINNFISGWILLAERPVRLGDVVEAEGSTGRVAQIGARCTRIRRMDGIDVLVPNSKLIENVVVNWTLTDDVIRTAVRVGVAYGSPTEKVAQLIRRAMDEQPGVLRDPEPEVIFEEFGDNALIFDAYLWSHSNGPMALREIASEVRLRIDALCREAGITIAYPQRDVHLNAVRPIEVKLIEPREPHG